MIVKKKEKHLRTYEVMVRLIKDDHALLLHLKKFVGKRYVFYAK